MQLTFFYFLPNILLSGFMFPFRGMPDWAQAIGSVLPLTYFMRLVRGILLKGNDWPDLWPSLWPMIVFTLVVMADRGDASIAGRSIEGAGAPCLARAVAARVAPSARTSARRIRPRSIATCRSAARRRLDASRPSATFPRSGGRSSRSPEIDALVRRALAAARRSTRRVHGSSRRASSAPRARRHAVPAVDLDRGRRAAAHRPGDVRVPASAELRARSPCSASAPTSPTRSTSSAGRAASSRGSPREVDYQATSSRPRG